MPCRPRGSLRTVVLCLGIALGVLTLLTGAAAAVPRTLTIGFTEPPDGAALLQRAVAENAQVVRVGADWSGIAPAVRPAGFDASDPASPGYDFTSLDAAIESVSASGLRVMLTISSAPTWAEGANMPRNVQPGTWRPNAGDFGQLARALATRYDGHFPDPRHPGQYLPRVSIFQGWNEPNLSYYLTPQWTRHGHGWSPASPGILRSLDNAFYSGIKAIAPTATVVEAGTAPYGDPPGGQRMAPVAFYRSLFCLQGRKALRRRPCPSGTSFDALDHHPYGVGSPTTRALNPDDVAIPDLHKITRVLSAAEHDGRALPRGRKQMWVTEYSWDSDPPDPHGVPIQTQARWLEQAMYMLWRQGADTVLWLELVDAPPIPNYASTYQAGLYYLGGKAKPAAVAFRFPFVTQRLSKKHVRVWSRLPVSGRLVVEVRAGHAWRTVVTVRAAAEAPIERTITLRGAHTLRAVIGGQTSLTWRQG